MADLMTTVVGITDDRSRVTIALLQNGRQLGWIEYTGEQCDAFLHNVSKYRGLLVDKLPPPTAK